MKGTVVSTILAVMPLLALVKAARRVARAELYLAMAAASPLMASVPWAMTAGVRWMAVFEC